jgi:dolichol kinase
METTRRLIHISGFFTIVLTELLGKTILSIIILCTTILYLISEYLRLRMKQFPIIAKITRLAARAEESSNWILSPVSYAAGIIVALNLFPNLVNYATICVLTIGDGLSSLVGIKFGQRPIPYNRNKTVEGAISCFVASLISTLIFVDPPVALIGSLVGAFAESLPSRYYENIIVPVAAGLCMSILSSLTSGTC